MVNIIKCSVSSFQNALKIFENQFS